jgi:hypothetical protein
MISAETTVFTGQIGGAAVTSIITVTATALRGTITMSVVHWCSSASGMAIAGACDPFRCAGDDNGLRIVLISARRFVFLSVKRVMRGCRVWMATAGHFYQNPSSKHGVQPHSDAVRPRNLEPKCPPKFIGGFSHFVFRFEPNLIAVPALIKHHVSKPKRGNAKRDKENKPHLTLQYQNLKAIFRIKKF